MARLRYENVKEEIESKGWELISTEYINLDSDLEMRCPNGHLNVISLKTWRHHECPLCKDNIYANINEKPVKKNGFRVLAFDQASITSGWSVFDNETLVKFGAWTSNGTKSTERISLTKGWFASMISKWKPDEVILEDIQLQHFGDQEGVITFKKLAHLQGVLKNYCYENGINYRVVPVATWRNFSSIKGKSRSDRKKNAQLKVQSLYDIKVGTDVAEAILIGRWGAGSHERNKIIKF